MASLLQNSPIQRKPWVFSPTEIILRRCSIACCPSPPHGSPTPWRPAVKIASQPHRHRSLIFWRASAPWRSSIIGLAMTRSRAGMILAFVSLLGSFALVSLDKRKDGQQLLDGQDIRGRGRRRDIAVRLNFAFYRVLERFGADPLDDIRWSFAERTLEAGKAYFPFGSGFGTFPLVYGTFQRVDELLPNTSPIAPTTTCWKSSWRGAYSASRDFHIPDLVGATNDPDVAEIKELPFQVDEPYARAATLVVPLLVLHSFLDYPLRTGGIMAILAVACGLIVPSPPATEKAPSFSYAPPRPEPVSKRRERAGASSRAGASKERGRTAPPQSAPPKSAPPDVSWPPPKPPKPEEGAGLDDFEWPDEWRKK